jgi:hypothetical protein
VEVATIDVWLLDPQAHRTAAHRATLESFNNLNMAYPPGFRQAN